MIGADGVFLHPVFPGIDPHDENPSAECQELRCEVAMLRDNLAYLITRAAAVAQWSDAVWNGHVAWPDVALLRGAIDAIRDEVPSSFVRSLRQETLLEVANMLFDEHRKELSTLVSGSPEERTATKLFSHFPKLVFAMKATNNP